MDTEEILDAIADNYPDCLTADGFDDAIIGIIERACCEPLICYDFELCVEILMRNSEMDQDEAVEFLEFNTTSAYMGEFTPVFLHRWRDLKPADPSASPALVAPRPRPASARPGRSRPGRRRR